MMTNLQNLIASPLFNPKKHVVALNFAAVLDRHQRNLVITDDMIRDACRQLELAQGLPFSARLRGDE